MTRAAATAVLLTLAAAAPARAHDLGAKAELRGGRVEVEAYFSDNGHYTGMTAAGLAASYDQSINPSIIEVVSAGATSYCVQATSPNDVDKIAVKRGPSSQIVVGTVASGTPAAC